MDSIKKDRGEPEEAQGYSIENEHHKDRHKKPKEALNNSVVSTYNPTAISQ